MAEKKRMFLQMQKCLLIIIQVQLVQLVIIGIVLVVEQMGLAIIIVYLQVLPLDSQELDILIMQATTITHSQPAFLVATQLTTTYSLIS